MTAWHKKEVNIRETYCNVKKYCSAKLSLLKKKKVEKSSIHEWPEPPQKLKSFEPVYSNTPIVPIREKEEKKDEVKTCVVTGAATNFPRAVTGFGNHSGNIACAITGSCWSYESRVYPKARSGEEKFTVSIFLDSPPKRITCHAISG